MQLESGKLDRVQKITTIADLNPLSCNENEKITNIISKILSSGHRSMPVTTNDNKIIGIMTIMDVLGAIIREQKMEDKISAIMSRDVIFCNSDDTIGYTLQRFKISRKGRFPILDDDVLIGIVTERDIVKRFSETKFNTKIDDKMVKGPFYMKPQTTVLDCLKSMVNTRYRRLPIVDNGMLVGMETVTEVLKYLNDNNFNLEKLRVPAEELMIKNVFSVGSGADLSEAIKIMKTKDVGGLPVVDNGILNGFITERDILEEIE